MRNRTFKYKTTEADCKTTYDFLVDVNPDNNKIGVRLMINKVKSTGKELYAIQFEAAGSTLEEAKRRLAEKAGYLSSFALPSNITLDATKDILAMAV